MNIQTPTISYPTMTEETVPSRVPSSVSICRTLDLSEEMSLGSDITDPLFEWDHHCECGDDRGSPLERADFSMLLAKRLLQPPAQMPRYQPARRRQSISNDQLGNEQQLTINNSSPKPAMHTIHQELIDLKLQIAKQREKIDILSSKLSTSQVENEAVKAENSTLVEELTQAREIIENNSMSKRFNPFSSIKTAPSSGGSMQMLIDTNARLTTDNNRLEASVDAIRNSFQSYIKFVQRSSRADKESIDLLARENEDLRVKLNIPKKKNKSEVHMSNCTSKTSLKSESDDVTAPEENDQEETHTQEQTEQTPAAALQVTHLMNRFDIPEIKTSNKSSVTETEEDNNEDEDFPRRRSEELLVDFGTRPRQQKEQNRRRGRGSGNGRRWNSVVY